MEIAIVTTWKTRCGIATYSEALAKALSEEGVKVYIVRLNRLGRKTTEYFENLALRRMPKVDLMLIENEYGLFQGGESVFYANIRRAGVPVVTTMHAVSSPIPDEIVSENSEMVIVHNEFCKRRFTHECVVIPHGVQSGSCLPLEEAKSIMGLEGPVVTVFGFIAPYKGIEMAIRTVGLEFPDMKLVVAGGWHVDLETTYIARLKQMAEAIAPGQVAWTGWVPDEDLPKVFGASDICLYPNLYATESGALLTMVGYGRCVLARAIPPVVEKEGALMTFSDDNELILKMEELLGDPELRHKYEEGAKRYAGENSWRNVAKKHLEAFGELI